MKRHSEVLIEHDDVVKLKDMLGCEVANFISKLYADKPSYVDLYNEFLYYLNDADEITIKGLGDKLL